MNDYTEEQVLVMNQQEEIENLRLELRQAKHDANHKRWRDRVHLTDVLNKLLPENIDEHTKHVDTAIREQLSYADRPIYAAIYIGDDFAAWYNPELEQTLCDLQSEYYVYHFTREEVAQHGLELPEIVQ